MPYNPITYTIFGYLIPKKIQEHFSKIDVEAYGAGLDDYFEYDGGNEEWFPGELTRGEEGDGRSEVILATIGIRIDDLNNFDKEIMTAKLLQYKDFLKEKYKIDMDDIEPKIHQTICIF